MAAYVVTSLSDIVDPGDGLISLREAIQSANQDSYTDTIQFDSTLTQSGPGVIRLDGSELVIRNPVTIIGPTESLLTIDANRRSRVLRVDDGFGSLGGARSIEVSISNLKFTSGNTAESGGAILNFETLILIGCTVTESSAASGGGIFNSFGYLNIWETSIFNNSARESGGGILSQGLLSIVDTTVAQNSAQIMGGGIELVGSDFVSINSTIAGNTAVSGAGGIHSIDRITSGGVAIISGTGISGASGKIARLNNTLVAGNVRALDVPDDIQGISQAESNNNLIGSIENSRWTNGALSNIVGIDWKTVIENDGVHPILKNNGGKSESIALLSGSPAIDNGYEEIFSDIGTRTDQRGIGFPRKSRTQVDIGAYERPKEETTSSIVSSSAHYVDGNVTFTIDVKPKESGVTQIPTGSVLVNLFRTKDRAFPIDSKVVTLVDGKASLTISEENLGVYRVEAAYQGDDIFQISEAPFRQQTSRVVDYGDAPSSVQSGFTSSYPVTFEQDGARHSRFGPHLGLAISSEIDGVPYENASSDSGDDGVAFLTSLIAAETDTTASLVLNVLTDYAIPNATAGKLDAWIDYNRDGDWNDFGEKIFDSALMKFGDNVMSFKIPAGASVGQSAARFRLSQDGGLDPTGAAYDGEVEDYIVSLASNVGDQMALSSHATSLISEILTLGNDVVIYSLTKNVLFRAPLESAGRIELDASSTTPSTTFWFINNLQLQFQEKLSVTLGATSDFVSLTGAGQTLTLSSRDLSGSHPRSVRVDITGAGDNTLNLSITLDRLRIQHNNGDKIVEDWLRLIKPAIIEGQFVHRLTSKPLWGTVSGNVEIVNQTPFQNPKNRFDSDFDSDIAPTDALATINSITRRGSRELGTPVESDLENWRYTDVNGDNFIAPVDVLLQINELRRRLIPPPSFGGFGTIAGNSSIMLSNQYDLVRGTMIGGGTVTGTSLYFNTPYKDAGSIKFKFAPEVIENRAKMSVRGYTIWIGLGGGLVIGAFKSNNRIAIRVKEKLKNFRPKHKYLWVTK